MMREIYQRSFVWPFALIMCELREYTVMKKIKPEMKSAEPIQLIICLTLLSLPKTEIPLPNVVEMMVVLLQINKLYLPVFKGLIIDILVEDSSHDNRKRGKGHVVKTDVEVIEDRLSRKSVIKDKEELGHGKYYIFEEEILDHLSYSQV